MASNAAIQAGSKPTIRMVVVLDVWIEHRTELNIGSGEELAEVIARHDLRSITVIHTDDMITSEWAKQHGFTIVSKDTDFYQRSIFYGHPPKFVWLRVGNWPTRLILSLLRSRHEIIREFIQTETESLLVIERPKAEP